MVFWELTREIFSGFFNVGTLLGVIIAVVIYLIVWCISSLFQKGKDLQLVVWLSKPFLVLLSRIKNSYAQYWAMWLWRKIIIDLGATKLCRTALYGPTVEDQVWAIRQLPNRFIIVQFLSKRKAKKSFKRNLIEVFKTIGAKPIPSSDVMDAMQDSEQKIEQFSKHQ